MPKQQAGRFSRALEALTGRDRMSSAPSEKTETATSINTRERASEASPSSSTTGRSLDATQLWPVAVPDSSSSSPEPEGSSTSPKLKSEFAGQERHRVTYAELRIEFYGLPAHGEQMIQHVANVLDTNFGSAIILTTTDGAIIKADH